ncbi:fructosamine kinase family protein [Gilvimarinus agarilyticus]|uniref:fructosamine kinase family protein n=1 Tax=Gilvimarinus agarilyticus TaxID=679259 RepID=UPI0005A1B17F|nr:fructosamine kinase family protein [Gilvimarinus agarilyticus]
MNSELIQAIEGHFGLNLTPSKPELRAGGDTSQSFVVNNSQGKRYFIKVDDTVELLEVEAQNLKLMARAEIITPAVIGFSQLNGKGVLVLEYVSLVAAGDEQALGRQLADLHRVSAEHYGLDYNNYIGGSPQQNTWGDNWADFWWHNRLAPQLEQATRNRGVVVDTQRLKHFSDRLLGGHQPPASLLHGDLWGGNKGFLQDGQPVLFDPACYYGDRETDLAFTLVFGGFGHGFYQSYREAWPLPDGWQEREPLYNLYHLLNHFNLFGDSYRNSVESTVASLLA